MTTSNTHIRIRRSTLNAAPELLNAGELAYSYVSNTLFLGTAGGDGVLKLGGEAYTKIIEDRTAQANANTLVLRDDTGSFSANVITANNINIAADGDLSTNTIHANTIYGALGSATGVETGTWGSATQVPVLDIAANGLITGVTTANISTTMGFSDGTNTETLNLIDGTLEVLGVDGITSTVTANTITIGVDDTILRSNTEGGPQHVSTDVQISGNLTVQGTTTYVQTSINQTDDSMIELASNNTVGDVLDIGFYGKHELGEGGGTVVTGLVRNAGTSDFYLFDNIQLGDQENLTSNVITQASLEANGATMIATQFLGSQGIGSVGGFSFSGTEGGRDSGMFSPADGELNFYSNSVEVFSSNTSTFKVKTPVQIDSGYGLSFKNADNTDNITINNQGDTNQSRLMIGDNYLEQNILAVDTFTSNNATQVTLFNSTDVRDYVTGETVLVKGEQKYGVVTQFLVNGNDPVTQKEIIDPLVPPAVKDMLPVDLGTDYDDTFVEIVTPFDIVFNGNTYGAGTGALFVGSNGYLTFGSGTNNNSHQFPPIATNPGYPAIVVALGDISYQRVYTHDDGNGHFRVRYEGSNIYNGQRVGGSSSIIWEVVFYRDVPGKFDVRIVRMNGTANNGTDGRWNTYLTDGSNFLDTRNDRTIPWTTYTQFAKQLTNGSNTLELLDDGTVKMPNGTVLSDADSGLFVDSLREDGTASDIVYYNTTTKELTYGTLADIRADVLSNGSYSWSISGDNGSLISSVGTVIGASSDSVVIGQNVDLTNTNANRVAIGNNAGNNNQGYGSTAVGENAGQTNQSNWSVALGLNAGNDTQGHSSVAVGHTAGRTSQGSDAVAVGVGAGKNSQGNYAVAIGERAGYGDTTAQGVYSIAIGARAGYSAAFDNSIILNASGIELNSYNTGLFINPIRYVETQDVNYDGIAFYNASTKEMTYSYILDGGDF